MNFEFGVLPTSVTIASADWTVEPRAEYQALIDEWEATGASRDWVYPPIQHTERSVGYDTETGERMYEPVPESERGALLWRVPATHTLTYRGAAMLDAQHAKTGIATFLIYLVGTIYGVEVQHADWAVVGRQRKRRSGLFVTAPGDAATLLDRAASWFASLPAADVQTTITSALYLHNHVPGYEFEWERFAWQYSVVDAAWCVLTGDRNAPHAKRFELLATRIGAKQDRDQFARWVDLRNNLMHQVLWGKATPGHRPLADVRSAFLLLRNFATIALLAAVGYTGPGLQADWMSRAQHRL